MKKLNYDKPPIKKALVVRFDDEYLELIKAQAEQDSKSKAEIVRTIVRHFYREAVK